jgi:exodeoxyribonuclease VII large subunit
MFNNDEIYPVSHFVQLCSKIVKDTIPLVWISGEISNLSTPNSGHIYFTLKDNNAQLSCAFFKFSNQNLKFQLENGAQIMVRGGATIYEARGNFQMVVQNAQPIGVGSLELGFEQLKKKLQAQGMFNDKHKKPLPLIPHKIGVITSKTGAVLQDIIKVLQQRYPFTHLKVYDTQTQGEGASRLIISALQHADADHNDVLIIARGGGSREDLWCFNDEDLALAVFATTTPIVSSIGHEVDSTIIDFVADVYAPTPSAAAMLITPDRVEILQRLQTITTQLQQSILAQLQRKQHKYRDLNQRLTQPHLHKYYQRIDELELRLTQHIQRTIALQYARIETLTHNIARYNPQHIILANKRKNIQLLQQLLTIRNNISAHKQNVSGLEKHLHTLMQHALSIAKNNLIAHSSALGHLNPLQVLERGYSITKHNGKVIHSAVSIHRGDTLITHLSNGEITSVVQ